MKKYLVILLICAGVINVKAQVVLGIDAGILKEILSYKTVSGFTFEAIHADNTITGTFVDLVGSELVLSFDSLKRFEEVIMAKQGFLTIWKQDGTRMMYFQNEYATALYAELKKYHVTMALVGYSYKKNTLEKVYYQLDPDKMLKQARARK